MIQADSVVFSVVMQCSMILAQLA